MIAVLWLNVVFVGVGENMSSEITRAALDLYKRGLSIVPAVDDDGKSVAGVVSGFQTWRRRLPRTKVEDLFKKHAPCTIALLVGHCDLVVVDCDSEDALTAAETRFGYSPILVRTPGGKGGHYYYRAPADPVRQANLRASGGPPIDIKAGKGAYVIVPPSVRPSSGVAYRFERGGWDDIPSLPMFLDKMKVGQRRRQIEEYQSHGAAIEQGYRNDYLYRRALSIAQTSDSFGELETILQCVNANECEPPLEWAEVEKTAKSAWGIQVSGRNRVGRGQYVIVPRARLDVLLDCADALLLDTKLRVTHDGKRDRFCASPSAMADKQVLPGWTHHRYRAAIKVLRERGEWLTVNAGGKGAHDPAKYMFADSSAVPMKGTDSGHNTNLLPSPPLGADDLLRKAA